MKKHGKSFEEQLKDENVLLLFRAHPIVMRKGLLIMLVILVIAMLPLAIKPTELWLAWIVLAGFLLGFLVIFYSWIGWYFSVFIVTDQRFVKIGQKGLFKRSVVDIGLGKILSVNYTVLGLQETILGFGTIILQTYVGDLILECIHHPDRMSAAIVDAIKEGGFDVAEEEVLTETQKKGKRN